MGTYIVVARSRASAILYPGINLTLESHHPEWGKFKLVFRTRYQEQGFDAPVPRDFWVEVTGSAADLHAAVAAFVGTAAEISSIVAVCVNATMGQLEVEIVFDATPANAEHEYFQSFVPESPTIPVPGRRIDVEAVGAVLGFLASHEERPRITRAIAQYAEALSSWRLGREISCIAHLYMGVEALTKAALRQHSKKTGKSEGQLAIDWQIDGVERRRYRERLNGEARRRLIFGNDEECYQKAKEASDAFEHGYRDYGAIREPAKEILIRTAAYLRHAIFDTLGLEEALRIRILAEEYAVPRGPMLLVRYIFGNLIGKVEDLAAPDQQYPCCEWRSTLKKVAIAEDGRYGFAVDNTLTVKIGEKTQFRPEHYEVWDGSTMREVPKDQTGSALSPDNAFPSS